MGTHFVFHKRKKKLKPFSNEKTESFAKVKANELIDNATPAEIHLKAELEQRKIKFNFQYPIIRKNKCYIVDFHFPRYNKTYLIVEVDGGYHLTDRQKEKDAKRSKWIYEHTGAEILRYTNGQVFNNTDSILTQIISKDVIFI